MAGNRRFTRDVLISTEIGLVSAIFSFLFGMLILFAGFSKASWIFLWPYIALKGLAPCLPVGDPACEGDTITSGVVFLSFGLSLLEYSVRTYLIFFWRRMSLGPAPGSTELPGTRID
jgi:hypothetical protein